MGDRSKSHCSDNARFIQTHTFRGKEWQIPPQLGLGLGDLSSPAQPLHQPGPAAASCQSRRQFSSHLTQLGDCDPANVMFDWGTALREPTNTTEAPGALQLRLDRPPAPATAPSRPLRAIHFKSSTSCLAPSFHRQPLQHEGFRSAPAPQHDPPGDLVTTPLGELANFRNLRQRRDRPIATQGPKLQSPGLQKVATSVSLKSSAKGRHFSPTSDHHGIQP